MYAFGGDGNGLFAGEAPPMEAAYRVRIMSLARILEYGPGAMSLDHTRPAVRITLRDFAGVSLLANYNIHKCSDLALRGGSHAGNRNDTERGRA